MEEILFLAEYDYMGIIWPESSLFDDLISAVGEKTNEHIKCENSNINMNGYIIHIEKSTADKMKRWVCDTVGTHNMDNYHYMMKIYSIFFRRTMLNKYILILKIRNIDEVERDCHNDFFVAKIFLSYFIREYNLSVDIKKAGSEASQKIDLFVETIKEVIRYYNVYAFGNESDVRKIGEKDGKKKVCRFCGRSRQDRVSFSSKAHVIPEAFGNKILFCNEECNDCNNFLGKNAEEMLVRFFDIDRWIMGCKGKNGFPCIKSNTGIGIRNNITDGQRELIISGVSNSSNMGNISKEGQLAIQLDFNGLDMGKVYKALAKMFIETIDSKYLKVFQKTVQWVMSNENMYAPLPMYYKTEEKGKSPTLVSFIRNLDNQNLPFAFVKFYFGRHSLGAVIPYCDLDMSWNEENNIEYLKKLFFQNDCRIILAGDDPIRHQVSISFKYKGGPIG